jgi:molecular chaperone DnaK (HSP70)
LAGNTELSLSERLNLGISIGLPDGSLHRLFCAGEGLPAQCSRQFTTHQNKQSAILLELFQGNASMTERCERLGSLSFGGLREGPAGHVQLSVRFQLNEEGRLDIRATDPTTGEKVEAHLDTAPPPPTQEEAPQAPPPLRMALPGLSELQATLEEEAAEEEAEEAEEEAAEEERPEDLPQSQEVETPPSSPPAIEMPALPPLAEIVPEEIAYDDVPEMISAVRLGDNKPYPFHLSFRDWIRDFFGGLFGN